MLTEGLTSTSTFGPDEGAVATLQARHQNDSDNESGVMVRMRSQDSSAEGAVGKASLFSTRDTVAHGPDTPGVGTSGGDWIVVDEENKSLDSSAVNIQSLSLPGNPTDAGEDEEAQLAAAIQESERQQRQEEVQRKREDRQLEKALEASKMEAVAYALGSLDVGPTPVAQEQTNDAGLAGGSESDSGEDTDSTTGWTSSDDEDDQDRDQEDAESDEEDNAETEAEIRKQAAERLKVLEAAGVLVKADESTKPESLVTGVGNDKEAPDSATSTAASSTSKPMRRPPPPPGQKRHKNIDELILLSRSRTVKKGTKPEQPTRRKPPSKPKRKPSRDLPPVPPSDEASHQENVVAVSDKEGQTEDAYDRYLKLTKEISLRPILPATATGAIGAAPPRTPLSPTAVPGSPARKHMAPNDAQSKAAQFLSSLKSMSNRARSDSGVGSGLSSRIVSGPIAVGSSSPSPGLLSPAMVPDSGRNSGEILDISTDPPAASVARVGAPSWSSLVGPDLLSNLSDLERKRQESIFELITTESAHVRDLQIVVEVFFNSLQPLLSTKASTVIFANIEDLLFTSVSFLSDLEERQKADRLYVTVIGDILSKHIDEMTVYLPYCINEKSASEILESERKKDTRIDIHLMNLRKNHPAARGLDLSHFLLVPMQRLTRYPLLLGQMLKYTPEDHPDYEAIAKAKATAEEILNKANEEIRDQENSALLSQISTNLWLGEEAKLDLTKPFTTRNGERRQRRVLRDEMVAKAKSGRKLRLVLTTDLLLVLNTTDGGLYRMPIPVKEVSAEAGKKSKPETLSITHVVEGLVGGEDVLKLKASSARNARLWITAVNAAKESIVRDG